MAADQWLKLRYDIFSSHLEDDESVVGDLRFGTQWFRRKTGTTVNRIHIAPLIKVGFSVAQNSKFRV